MIRGLFPRFSSFVRLYNQKNALRFSDAEKICDETHLVGSPDNFLNYGSAKMMISQYPFFVRDSLPRSDPKLVDVIERYDELCYYTGPDRELYPGPIVMDCYKALESPENLTVKNLRTASLLAWALETAITSVIIIDDILDGHVERWKKPTWHAQPQIGLTALTDSKLFTMGSFAIIRKYLKNHPNYKHFHKILSDLVYLTNAGQALDSETAEKFVQTRQLNLLTMERYLSIVKYKTHFTMYEVPPLAAMYLSNIDTKLYFDSRSLFETFSIYRQAQNDMWDVYSEYKTIGKKGSDIAGGNCTWVTGTALLHANQRQKKALEENYGKFDAECQKVVYEVFHELDILGKFKQFREDFIRECNDRTRAVGHPGFTSMINTLLAKYIAVSEDFQL